MHVESGLLPSSKILFIGIDALDKDLILRWAKEGLLPSFRTLLEKGAWELTTNPPGLYVGAVWPSFFTGVSPARHGRYCHTQITPGTYDNHRFHASEIKWGPFWNDLSRAGKRLAVIDVPKTFLCRNLNGIQIVDWGTHDPDAAGFCTWPTSLATEVEARFGRDPVGACDKEGRGDEELEALRDALLNRIERKAEISRYFLEQGGWDLFLTVFSESHCAGHQFWHLHDPTHPKHDEEMARYLGDPIQDIYIAIDAAVGQLLERVGSQTTVFVLASHGMGPHYSGNFLLDEILRRLENAKLSMTHRKMAEALRWIWERTPLALRKPLRPVQNRIQRRLAEALPAFNILGTHQCFQVPNNDVFGGIRIKLVGREPHGRIRPGAECEAFCEELSRDLLTLVNLDTGKPVVRKVLRTADLYHGEQMDHLPDLMVEWNQEAPISSIYSPKTGRIEGIFSGNRTGDHKPNGIFMVMGPSITPGRLERTVSIMDFAPTLALLLGVGLPKIDGQPILALTGPPFADRGLQIKVRSKSG